MDATHSQSLKVTDLPPEIHHEIFSHFKDARMGRPGRVDWHWNENYDDLPAKRHAIANSRLTCRLFHQLATPMLLPTVRVKLEQPSLDRLDEISRIPAVAGSVRGLEIILAYRPKEIATDIRGLVVTKMKDVMRERDPDPFGNVMEMVQAWVDYAGDPTVDTTGDEHKTLLRESFAEYQRLHAEQDGLISSGAFVDGIAAAVARMPLFGSILFNDEDVYAGHPKREEREESEEPDPPPPLHLSLTAAEKWAAVEAMESLEARRAPLPPARILSDLPVAIHAAGATLREIGVNCFPMTGGAEGTGAIRNLDALRAACQQLEEVVFWPLADPRRTYVAEARGQITGYLSALLSGRSLETLSVRVAGITKGYGPVGPALGGLDGTRLRTACIEQAQLTQAEWDGFCAGIGGQLRELTLANMRLAEGEWEPSMGVLRGKMLDGAEGGDLELMLLRLSGGGFGDGEHIRAITWSAYDKIDKRVA
ncbi:hypothetical protein IMZ48_37515 [Candidatus Bathyarchaeota archaeon]|nr:hypothetical protein [Candidatus Bathyarchaeota archaeon]